MNSARRHVEPTSPKTALARRGTRRAQPGSSSLVSAAVAALIAGLALPAQALPTGAQVASGSAAVGQNGSTLTVHQASAHAVINWQGFGIAAGETVNFVQPSASAVALNRVVGDNASAIFGKLNANGQVFLLNPNGIVFGRSAEVSVGGLVASTLKLSDGDFLAGKRSFSGASVAGVHNLGRITADGGYIALLGAQVINEGTLQAQLGTVALAAGQQTTLDFAGDRLIRLQVDQGALQALADNRELIRADGGTVLLSARAADRLVAAVVNNSGLIQARTLQNRGGVISLLGDMQAGVAQVGGSLDASAPNGGNGGFVETSAAQVRVADSARITTAAAAGLTGRWLIDPQDYTVAASGGDISGATLSANLATSNVALQSSGGASAGAGNLNVNDGVNWSANTTLTLIAANHVNVNANLSASGATAGLVISPNTANGADAASGSGRFKLGNGARINLPNVAASSTTALVIAGTPYTVINSLGVASDSSALTLQGISGQRAGHYALGSDIDASATASWNSGAGFAPIGSGSSPFTGSLDGLGHHISGLTINRPASSTVGLFGSVGLSGVVQNIGLLGGSVGGNSSVGALAGRNKGRVSNSFATSQVSGSVGGLMVGGMVGFNEGSLEGVYATGQVTGTDSVGGLVGVNAGTLGHVYATGQVSAASGGYATGGLAGENSGLISQAYATGAVIGSDTAGGLVGNNTGSIGQAYASGSVSGSSGVGALIGNNAGAVTSGYWNSEVRANGIGGGNAAGALGLTGAQMRSATSFAGFGFTSTPGAAGWVLVDLDGSLNNAGGAAGATSPMLASEYAAQVGNAHQLQLMAMAPAASYRLSRSIDASATASARDVWGGTGFAPIGNAGTPFTGTLDGASQSVSGLTIQLPDASSVGLIGTLGGGALRNLGLVGGSISGGSNVGALVGNNIGGSIANVYSSAGVVGDSSGDTAGGLVGNNSGSITNAYASGNVSGYARVGGLVGYNAGGTVSNAYASGSVSGSSQVGGLIGRAFAGAISDSFWNSSVIATGVGLGSSSGAHGLNNAQILSQANFSSATAANGNANPGWDFGSTWIQYDGHSAPLLRSFMAPLTVTADSATKVYDRQAYTANTVRYSVAPDGRLLGTPSFSGSASGATQVGSYTITPGGLYSTQQGYAISQVDGTLAITPATLTVQGSTALNKVYDRSSAASVSGGTLSGVFAGDTVTLSQAGLFASANVANAIAVTATNTLGGASAGNYSLVQPVGLSANITPKSLTVGGSSVAANKVYDGNTSAVVSGGQLQGVIAGDQVTLAQSGSFASRNVGTGLLVTASDSLGGAAAANYSLVQPTGLSASISARTLVVGNATMAADKVYDTSTAATVSGGVITGMVAGDQLSFSQSGSFVDKNAGNGKTVNYSNQLAGTDAGNYSLSSAGGSVRANVSAKTLTVLASPSANKVYDGTTTADLSGNLSGVLGSDEVVLAGSFSTKAAGIAKTVSFRNQLGGNEAANYSLGVPNGTVLADITPKLLTVTGTTASAKAYDGTTKATLMGGGLVGLVAGDNLKLVQVGVFASKNAGINIAVTAADRITGNGARNYILVQPTVQAATISPKLLRVTRPKVAAKTYDGNTSATVSGGKISGVLAGDVVDLAQTAQFVDRNAGRGKAVVYSNSLTGADAGNYAPAAAFGTGKATIKPLQLLVDDSFATAADKTFDGTTAATVSGSTIEGVVDGDRVLLSQSGRFLNAAIGADKVVIFKNALLGLDRANYGLSSKGGRTTAEILEP